MRLGNWLTADQGRFLLSTAWHPDLRSKRNYAILALLLGYGLRRGEVLALSLASVQLREDHWVIADLYGKAGHIRTVPVPSSVKTAIDRWTEANGAREGTLFRAVNKAGRIWGDGMTPNILWGIVKQRLCHLAGGELEDPVSSRPRIDPDDGTLPRLQAETSIRRQRQDRH